MALGVLKAASELAKKKYSGGYSFIVGYDNIPKSNIFFSPLTANPSQNFSGQGKKIVAEIKRRIQERNEGKEDTLETEIMTPELIIRESSQKIR